MESNVAEEGQGGEKPLDPGTRLGRYQITCLIGQGGMGAVYEALHVDLKKRVAIKALLRKHASNQDLRARFLREGEAASRIRHPNVVDVTDVGMDRGVPYLVMEYLSGESLAQMLAREERLPLHSAVALMLPVFSAVAEGHRRGVVHRDLKPENIFITKNRADGSLPKVLDFGISKLGDDNRIQTVTGGSTFLGTVTYMSPEQARAARTVDGRSDEYSLAVVLYQAVTGKTPHDAENTIELIYKIAAGELQTPRTYRPDLPETFEAILLRALSASPADRFESVRAFGAALLPFANPGTQQEWRREFMGPPRPLTPPPPAPDQLDAAAMDSAQASAFDDSSSVPSPRRLMRHTARMPIMMAATAVVVGATSFIFLFRSDQRQKNIEPAPLRSLAAPKPSAPALVPPPAAIGERDPARRLQEETPLVVETEPAFARIELDGVAVATGRFVVEGDDPEQIHHLRVAAKGHVTREATFSRRNPPEKPFRLRRIQALSRRAQTVPEARQTARGTNNSLIIE